MCAWKLVRMWMLCGGVLAAVACGGGGDDAVDISALGAQSLEAGVPAVVQEVSDIPLLTAPVVGDVDVALTLKSYMHKGARSGVPVQDFNGDALGESASLGLCHQSQMFATALSHATESDVVMCYLQYMVDDIRYDGEAERIRMNLAGVDPAHPEEGEVQESLIVELIAEQNAGSRELENLTMKTCEAGQQTQFTEVTVSGNALSFYNKQRNGHEGSSVLELQAQLDSQGRYVSKALDVAYDFANEGAVASGEVSMEQGEEHVALSGWERGRFHGDQQYARTQSGITELLHGDDLQSIALGDGAAIGEDVGTEFDASAYREQWSEGWLGDSQQAITREQSHLGSHSALLELPSLGSAPDVSFVGGEQMDCDAPIHRAIDIDLANLAEVCGELRVDWQWFSCHEVVSNGNSWNEGPSDAEQGGEGDESYDDSEGGSHS